MSFDEAINQALTNPKYNILTGRSPDVRGFANNLLSRFIDSYVMPLLRGLINNLPELTQGAPVILYAASVLIILIIIITAVFIIKDKIKRKKVNIYIPDIYDGVNKNKTSENLLNDSLRLAQNGNFREAVRYDFIALLWVLNLNGVIYLKESKTNGQLKREVKKNVPVLYNNFNITVNIFNKAWFGNNITEDNYNKNRTIVLNLIKESGLYIEKRT